MASISMARMKKNWLKRLHNYNVQGFATQNGRTNTADYLDQMCYSHQSCQCLIFIFFCIQFKEVKQVFLRNRFLNSNYKDYSKWPETPFSPASITIVHRKYLRHNRATVPHLRSVGRIRLNPRCVKVTAEN